MIRQKSTTKELNMLGNESTSHPSENLKGHKESDDNNNIEEKYFKMKFDMGDLTEDDHAWA